MKVDRSNPLHWFYLALFSTNICIALLLRSFIKNKSGKRIVILYGHKLNGNLKGIYDYAEHITSDMDLFFLTFDAAYYRTLKQENKRVISGLNPLHMFKVASACALVSDHGLHSLKLLLKYSNIKFIDVWHGLPFKGFDPHDFITQRQYHEVWITSMKIKELYINRFGFPPEIIKVTGYARTDVLVNNNLNTQNIKTALGIIDQSKKIILFAPTWQQDEQSRNIYPFDIIEHDFLFQLDAFCRAHNAICILRKHLNTQLRQEDNYEHIHYLSSQQFPDTESILLISDILICDWSSIAFDYLLLNRPTLFLNVAPPFKKGFSLDSSYRFGECVNNMQEMLDALDIYLKDSSQYQIKYSERHKAITRILYDDKADGKAGERCFNRLLALP